MTWVMKWVMGGTVGYSVNLTIACVSINKKIYMLLHN